MEKLKLYKGLFSVLVYYHKAAKSDSLPIAKAFLLTSLPHFCWHFSPQVSSIQGLYL